LTHSEPRLQKLSGAANRLYEAEALQRCAGARISFFCFDVSQNSRASQTSSTEERDRASFCTQPQVDNDNHTNLQHNLYRFIGKQVFALSGSASSSMRGGFSPLSNDQKKEGHQRKTGVKKFREA
jgi:hypothetical protein